MKHPALFILLAALALVPFLAAPARAQVSLGNAATPEAAIGQCPGIPSASALARAHCGLESPSAAEFSAKLAALGQQIAAAREREMEPYLKAAKDAGDKQLKARTGKSIADLEAMSDAQRTAWANSFAEQQTKKLTGRSVAELQSMSEAEQQKMGMELANKMLAGSGVSGLDIADLQKMQGMDERQVLDQMRKKGVTIAGLSIEEIQNLQGMSDGMASVYMQEQGRMERVQDAAAKMKTPKTSDILAPGVTTAQLDAINKKSENLTAHSMQILEERQLYYKELMEIMKQTGPYWQKSRATKPDGSSYDDEERAAILTPAFGIWREYVIKRQGRLKTLLPLASEIDATTKAHLSLWKATAGAAAMQPELAAWNLAAEYLEMTASTLNGNP
jgi:hypothetical protein